MGPGDTVTVKVGSTLHSVPWVTSYGDVGEGEVLLHVDSVGLLAIAIRGGRADEEMKLSEGVSVSLAGRKSATTG
jgi:S-adenosylmethionine hydrolase